MRTLMRSALVRGGEGRLYDGGSEHCTVHGMSLHWMFLLVLKLYQMDVAHAILLGGKADFSRPTADYLSAKFE